MELVIKMSEADFDLLKSLTRLHKPNFWERAILNGTILPEPHGDLIDRTELKKKAYIVSDWMGGLSNIVEEFSIDDAHVIIPATERR